MITCTQSAQICDFLTIVSGLPRSGTSLMMRMLETGGLPTLTDGVRQADRDNPRGYYEFEPAKRTKEDPSWLEGTNGSAAKMVYRLLYDLPSTGRYRVLVMRRNMSEILASQRMMLKRLGKTDNVPDKTMATFFRIELEKFDSWIKQQPNFSMMEVWYNDLVNQPAPVVDRICEFLELPLDRAAMCSMIDPTLYRNRVS